MYITPQRFREMGMGVDIPEDDAKLAPLCAQASAVVDSYCNVPRIPQKHDFRGGTVTGEQHRWRIPYGPFEIGQRKYYPFHWPILQVLDFKIIFTNIQYLAIAPEHVVINNSERYWEIVSIALSGVGLYGLFNAMPTPVIGLADPLGVASYTYGWDFEVVDEELYCSDGQTWRAQNQWWFTDAERAPVVSVNGVIVTTGYTIDANEGTVIFDDNLLAADRVSATYHHKLPSDIQYGTAHVMAYLISLADTRSKGLGNLSKLRVAEVELTARELAHRGEAKSLAQDLDILVPEAALLLGGYAADNLTIR